MNHTLGNALAVLVRELLEKFMILQKDWSSRPSGQGVLVVGDGGSGSRSQALSHRGISILTWGKER
jgi:hypothetical protein